MKRKILFALIALYLGQGLSLHQARAGSNLLEPYQQMTGVYFVLRHGESVPSLEKRVCGSMEAGVDPKNGLTDKGKQEVMTSVTTWIQGNKKLISRFLKQNKLVIVSSPFSRTKESAEILADVLQENFQKILPVKYRAPGSLRNIIVIEDNLKERDFGKFEGQLNSGEIYKKVWAADMVDPEHTKWGVESTTRVQERATRVVARLEEESKKAGGKLFILVSHGDTLKIMQTGFQKQSPGQHANPAQVAPFKTAEIREFKLAGSTTQAQK
jgi:broad specificity phosphatase PhoE